MTRPVFNPGQDPELIEYLEAQNREYGEWIANQDIMHGNALAYTKGMAVPISNVEKWHYDELGWVTKTDSTEGKQIVKELGGNRESEEEQRASAPTTDDRGVIEDKNSRSRKTTKAEE